MEIDAEKSKLRPESDGIPIAMAQDGSVIRSPVLDTITAQATVSAADGETIILGGLISKESRSLVRKVPWLGDLPVLRYLFRYEMDQVIRSELLIILTPHVVRSQADMQRVKQAEFARMSWCEADVIDLHGDINIYVGPEAHSFDSEDWQVVYPDVEPRGRPLEQFHDGTSRGRTYPIPAEPIYAEPIDAEPMSQPIPSQPASRLPLTAQRADPNVDSGPNGVTASSAMALNSEIGLAVPASYQGQSNSAPTSELFPPPRFENTKSIDRLQTLGLPTVGGGE